MIEGKVVDGDGRPIAGATINGWDPAPRDATASRASSARSDSDGLFKLRNVAGGRWQLSVFAAGYTSLNVPNVEPGTTNVEARLTTLGWIEGQVFADGKPFAGSFNVSAQFAGSNVGGGGDAAAARVRNGMVVYDGGGQRDDAFSAP